MKVWVVYGWDYDENECYIEGVYTKRSTAMEVFHRIVNDPDDHRTPYLDPVEVDE